MILNLETGCLLRNIRRYVYRAASLQIVHVLVMLLLPVTTTRKRNSTCFQPSRRRLFMARCQYPELLALVSSGSLTNFARDWAIRMYTVYKTSLPALTFMASRKYLCCATTLSEALFVTCSCQRPTHCVRLRRNMVVGRALI